MDNLLDHWENEKKDNLGKHCHKQCDPPLHFLSVGDILGNEALVILSYLSRSMAKKPSKPFDTYVNGSTDRSWLRLQGCTTILSVDISFPVPCETRNQTVIWGQAWTWRNKLRAGIISRANLHKKFFATNVTLPPIYTLHARCHFL